jgi:hypothetical protein
VKRTTEEINIWHPFSRPLHGLHFFAVVPVMNRWAIVGRPLRGLGSIFLFAAANSSFGS